MAKCHECGVDLIPAETPGWLGHPVPSDCSMRMSVSCREDGLPMKPGEYADKMRLVLSGQIWGNGEGQFSRVSRADGVTVVSVNGNSVTLQHPPGHRATAAEMRDALKRFRGES